MYIEREALLNRLEAIKESADWDSQSNYVLFGIKEFINNAPAADVAPVKRGCWSLRCDSRQDFSTGEYDEDFYLECSECKRKVWDIDQSIAMSGEWGKLVEQYPYCHCGCKMDGGKPNEEL